MNSDFKRRYVKTSLTIVISNLSGTIADLIDGIVISRYLGVDYSAAYALIIPLVLFANAIAGLFGSGLQVLYGKNNESDRKDYLTSAVFASVIFSAVIAIVCLIIPKPILHVCAFGADAKLISDAASYLTGFAPGLFFQIMLIVLMPVIYIDNDEKRGLAITLTISAVDIILDFLFLPVGMFGIAMATTISLVAGFVVLVFHFRRTNFSKAHMAQTKEIVSYGLDSLITAIGGIICGSIMNTLYISMGKGFLSAYSILQGLTTIVYSGCYGIQQATLSMYPPLYGEKDEEGCKALIKFSNEFGIIMNVILGVLLILFRNGIAGVYTKDAIVAPLVSMAVILISASFPVVIISQNISAVMKTEGKLIPVRAGAAMSSFIAPILLTIFARTALPLNGMRYFFYFGQHVLVIITLLIFDKATGKYYDNIEG